MFKIHYHTLLYPKRKENKISTKDKIKSQHILLHLNLHKAATLYKAASNQSPEIIVKKKEK